MMRTAVFCFSVLLGLGQAPVLAQVTGPSSPSGAQGNVAAPSLEALRARRLDDLFARLAEAKEPRAARTLEREIATVLARSGSDTAELLMTRAMAAFQRQDHDLSLSLLDSVVDLYPDYAEARARRSVVYFMRHEYGRAVADIEEVLRLEPRHYVAMTGLGMILQQLGEEKQALSVFRRVLEINPQAERVPDLVKRLEPRVEGREL